MRSREVLANWLLCAVFIAEEGEQLTFGSDQLGGDGIVWSESTGQVWPTEHVMVPRTGAEKNPDVEKRILDAIVQKNSKGGAAYASGKTLIVFIDPPVCRGYPIGWRRTCLNRFISTVAWAVGLQKVTEDGSYIYAFTSLDPEHDPVPIWLVRILPSFDEWDVRRIQ